MKFVAVLIVGIVIGHFLTPVETNHLPPEKVNEFQNLIDNEAKNFALQKDAEAKLKAAEELYGKMMVLFLANLSLKSTHQYVPADKPQVVEEKAEVVKEETIKPIEKPAALLAESPGPVASQKPSQKTPQQIYDEFRGAHYVESFKAKERRLLGHYVGVLKRTKPKQTEDFIRFEFNLVQQGEKLSGDTLVTMTDQEGKEYSRNAGNGGNRALKFVPNQSDAYYVDASPTSFFMISFKHFPQITGAYYEKGELIGKVEMRKVQGDM